MVSKCEYYSIPRGGCSSTAVWRVCGDSGTVGTLCCHRHVAAVLAIEYARWAGVRIVVNITVMKVV